MKLFVLLAAALVPAVAMFLVDPIPQDPAYHRFADDRTLVGIPHFWNVASNVAFIAVGTAGLVLLSRPAQREPQRELYLLHLLHLLLFGSLILTGLGSAWYHLAPGNATLVWDRLGITVTIAALFSVIVAEHTAPRRGAELFAPVAILGIASVFYWAWSESQGAGDLRPYALVQFLPMLLIPLILLLYPSRFDRTGFIWWVIALYALAKFCELLDRDLLLASGLISGHSMKHIVAASAMLLFLHGLTTRRPRADPVLVIPRPRVNARQPR